MSKKSSKAIEIEEGVELEAAPEEVASQSWEKYVGQYWRNNMFITGRGPASGKVTREDLEAFIGVLNPESKLTDFIAETDVHAEYNKRQQVRNIRN